MLRVHQNRSRLALLAAAVLALGAACTGSRAVDAAARAPAQLAAAPVRVMTFNIRYGTAPDGEHAWPLRRALTFRVIRDFAPALLGIQEALRFQLNEIERELPHYGEIGVGRDDGVERGEYSAILFDRRRLELVEDGTFWLSDSPAVPGSMSWGNRITRIATWGRFRDRTTRATFYVFNTHWDHESQPSRERSATLLLERIRARAAAADPVLVLGDFNAGEDNAAFQTLTVAQGGGRGAVRLYDTFRAVHPDARETGTFHAFRGDRSGAKIDAILASAEWQTLAASIVLLSEDGRYPSDHYPVTATVVLRARAPPEALRVMSYNIFAGNDLERRSNLTRVAALIDSLRVDVVLLQEVDRRTTRSGGIDQAAVLAERTGMHAVFGRAMDYGGGEYGIAVLSRAPIRVSHVLPLEVALPEELAAQATEPRALLHVIMAAPGGVLHLLNTHLDQRARPFARQPQLFQLLAYIAERVPRGEPIILGGDLNALPDAAEVRALGIAFVDAWTACGQGDGRTFRSDAPTRRIDYILLAGASCTTAQVIDTRLSDHRPLIVDVLIGQR